MNRLLFILLSLLSLASTCLSDKEQGYRAGLLRGIVYNDTEVAPKDSAQLYFPPKTFADSSSYVGRDSFVNNWYSSQLYAMKEPVIFLEKPQNEIYRFTWLRTFHPPIAIRMEKHFDKYVVYWKQSSGSGGYGPGTLTVDKRRMVDKSVWDNFLTKLAAINFWNLETNDKLFGNDGAEWIVEGKKDMAYHVVTRWSPDSKNAYYQTCIFLLKLTNIKIKAREIY